MKKKRLKMIVIKTIAKRLKKTMIKKRLKKIVIKKIVIM